MTLGPGAGGGRSLLQSTPAIPTEVTDLIRQMAESPETAPKLVNRLAAAAGVQTKIPLTKLDIFHDYVGVFVVAFLVALVATPIMRRLAIINGIVDRPSEARKSHRLPVAYLGGVGVFLGIVSGVFFSYLGPIFGLLPLHEIKQENLDLGGEVVRVPLSILGGMMIIMLVGLLDDVLNISPRLKIGGQLFAAAFLAMEDVGVRVATQILVPFGTWVGNPSLRYNIPLPFDVPFLGSSVVVDLVYWTGTAIIAIFIIGACNSSNLVDGLDGLLSGLTAICVSGLLIVSLGLAAADVGPLDSARVTLCLAVIGGCLGFLPHNFNPAVIFLGDCGSMLLGYCTIIIILTLGDQGQTNLVIAGLVIYSVPLLDTALAIIRRKLSGKKISDADDQHLHHMLKRALGVKGAVLVLYTMGIGFAFLGIALTLGKARITYAVTIVFVLFIGVTAIKAARRKALEQQAAELQAKPAGALGAAPAPAPLTPQMAQPPVMARDPEAA